MDKQIFKKEEEMYKTICLAATIISAFAAGWVSGYAGTLQNTSSVQMPYVLLIAMLIGIAAVFAYLSSKGWNPKWTDGWVKN